MSNSKSKSAKTSSPKGKPSGNRKESMGLKEASAVIDPKTEEKIADKYTIGDEEPAANVHERHVNRNVDKGEQE